MLKNFVKNSNMSNMNENKICFVACVNDERLYEESVLYLATLEVPPGMEVELIAVREAESMTAGYQEAMEASDAKYKIYIHQDVFIVNRNILFILMDTFKKNRDIGMIGVVGAGELARERPVWWESPLRYGKVYNKTSAEEIYLSVYGEFSGDFVSVQAVDGVFMATQYDLPWRKDLFKGWHFYDISQSQEFIRHGCRVAVVSQQEPWLVHLAGRKNVDVAYKAAMEVFRKYYFFDEKMKDRFT